MKYLLIDTANSFFRARHIASRGATTEEKLGMSIHLTLASVQSVFRRFGGDDTHVVFCLEGRSWRKDYYLPYKRNRSEARAALSPKESAEDQLFWQTYDEFTTFLRDKTNTSVLRHEAAEADDLIARFIHLHPNDEHIIISSDGDYEQLLANNVKQYNGVTNYLITIDGIFDDKGKPVLDKKTKEPKIVGDIKFNLFEKCIRGDRGDNVFTAYPRVQIKKITEAYKDRESKGYSWNNFMLQKWIEKKPIEDENGNYITDKKGNYITEDIEHRVLDDYNRNVVLIDLTAQPQDVKLYVDNAIREGVRRTITPQVGIHFMKFCGKHELTRISEQAESYARWINKPYEGVLSE